MGFNWLWAYRLGYLYHALCIESYKSIDSYISTCIADRWCIKAENEEFEELAVRLMA